MFLSKPWILILVSITGISFLILLVIQFGWITKSIELDRQQFEDRMRVAINSLRETFVKDKTFQKNYLSHVSENKNFVVLTERESLGTIIHHKVDSVLKSESVPATAVITALTGSYCYLMNVIPEDAHNTALDHSQYKLCLCSNSYPVALDIGFNLVSSGKTLNAGLPGLIVPSVILILLLIALFGYAFYIINRQKTLAELKNDFINNLTHEFNTPLFSIGLTSNLLARSPAIQHSEKLKSYVQLISAEKTRLQQQVETILRLTAIESGAVLMKKEMVDMHELIKENIEGFMLVVTQKGGSISFEPTAQHYQVHGDQLHLFNAVRNLLDNAIKYCEKSPAIIVTTSNTLNKLTITITDNGAGIDKADLKLIFNKFYRVKKEETHDVKGFGLGLSYVKKIVELHDGSVEVKSKAGEGSVFTIHLPLPVY